MIDKYKDQHSNDFPDSFFRVSVQGICVQDGKIFLTRESDDKSGQWMLPGGGLDFGENMQEALKREVEEEVGLNVVGVSKSPVYTWISLFEKARGMDWYYSVVLAYQIDLAHWDFILSEDCVEAGFFSPEEMRNLDIYHQSAEIKKVFSPSDFN